MVNFKDLAFGSLLVPFVSAAAVTYTNNNHGNNITWGPCEEAPSPYECATVQYVVYYSYVTHPNLIRVEFHSIGEHAKRE
jgi:hypothetical protein